MVIVGAGVAGLAAARRLLKRNRTVVILEARSRLGGRAWSECTTLGLPFDRGATWLHAVRKNPFTCMAERLGFRLVDAGPIAQRFQIGSRRATRSETRELRRAIKRYERKILRAANAGRDVAGSETVEPHSVIERVAAVAVGALEYGVDLDQLSTVDVNEQIDSEDERLVAEGLGTLIAAVYASIPVAYDTIVDRIDWSGPGVSVMSTSGVVRGRAALVTIPTGVLQSGAISFTPELPYKVQCAIHDLPMATLNKAAFRLKSNALPVDAEGTWLHARMDGAVGDFLIRPAGRQLAVGFAGGTLARELEEAGIETAIDHYRTSLKDIFGADILKAVIAQTVTEWGKDRFALGAYSAARPGRAQARSKLRKAVIGERIWFAGEALDRRWATQIVAAYRSGRAAAAAIDRCLS